MELNNKNRNISLIIFILLFVLSLLLFYSSSNSNKEELDKQENNIKILSDYNRFFTVNSCIYKYISYLQVNDISNVLKILDEKYITLNSINETNIYNHIANLEGNYTFSSKKVYYEKIDDNNYKFYVFGYLIEDIMDSYGKKIAQYYIVHLNIKDETFSLRPFNENEFKEVENG